MKTESEIIEELNDKISDLEYELSRYKSKERIYYDILQNINDSINTLFKREAENERFRFGEIFDYRQNLVNLKESLDNYKKIYKINF